MKFMILGNDIMQRQFNITQSILRVWLGVFGDLKLERILHTPVSPKPLGKGG